MQGSSDNDLRKYQLTRNPAQYHYTNQGSNETLSEKSDYKLTMNAFRTLGFTTDEVNSIWHIIAAILHLGNITFKSMFHISFICFLMLMRTNIIFPIIYFYLAEDDNIVIDNVTPLINSSNLLKVTPEEMTKSLTHRVIAAHGDVMMKSHNTQQAEYGRDALAKAIYDRLFTWIISRINQSILVPGSSIQKRFNKVIGVLDIYGFEVFEVNSFEQFCINYCNEKLQQLFIELVLKQEQEEYRREGIEWTNIDYFNNQVSSNYAYLQYYKYISHLTKYFSNRLFAI